MTSLLLHDIRGASSSGNAPVTADDLSELIQSFNQVSRQLQATQSALHGEVARLKSELAQANAQLRRSRSLAALGEMAAGIAHEIRNPLASIQLYAQSLDEEVGKLPIASSLCGKISGAVRHLDAVVRDVLAFARDMTLQLQPASAADLIERALESCCALLSTHHVAVETEIDPPHQIAVDETLFIQALSNLIRNAVEAMVESGMPARVLTMSVRSEMRRCPDHATRERIVFIVQDSGPGIPAEVVDRMFNPFFTTRKTGTGLGLAIVHRIVDAHAGHISVGTAESGNGARMEICLPPLDSARSASMAPDVPEPPGDDSIDRRPNTQTPSHHPHTQQHTGDGTRRLAREHHA